MKWKNLVSNDTGAVLIGAIVVLVAVTAIGVTLIKVSNFEVTMATNEKCKEEARFNAESCAVSGIKLVKMVSAQASEQGILGIPEGNSKILGITYADAEGAGTKEEEFAQKVLGTLSDNVCEDFELTPPNMNMDAAANIRPLGGSANAGTAANRQISGYSYGIGLGGAGGGGVNKWFLIACRGGGCNGNGRHVSYSRYKKVLGIPGGM
jgi:hypothetical protein